MNNEVTVGSKTYFKIQCKDEFGNDLKTGGNKFAVSMIGKNLTTVGYDSVETILTDSKDGTY